MHPPGPLQRLCCQCLAPLPAAQQHPKPQTKRFAAPVDARAALPAGPRQRLVGRRPGADAGSITPNPKPQTPNPKPNVVQDSLTPGLPRLLVQYNDSSIDALALLPAVLQQYVTNTILEGSLIQILDFGNVTEDAEALLQAAKPYLESQPGVRRGQRARDCQGGGSQGTDARTSRQRTLIGVQVTGVQLALCAGPRNIAHLKSGFPPGCAPSGQGASPPTLSSRHQGADPRVLFLPILQASTSCCETSA